MSGYPLACIYSVPSAVLIYCHHLHVRLSQHVGKGASKEESGARQDDGEPSHSKSVSNLLPAARAGAGGVLKGFRRLEPKTVSVT